MRRIYCTLYDSTYCARGLVMIASLLRHSSEPIEVAVLALDSEAAHRTLKWVERAGRREAVTVHLLKELLQQEPRLEHARATRSHAEFCWTLGSTWTRAQARAHQDASVVYVDADLWFLADPEHAHAERGARPIGIHRHAFPPEREWMARESGRYNVGMVAFDPAPAARACLERWAERCIERCDASTCGDQRYLDTWPTDYPGAVHEWDGLRVGLATWNVWAHRIERAPDGRVLVDGRPATFYHFHEHRRDPSWPGGFNRTRGYPLSESELFIIYLPYEQQFLEMERTA